jgi:hypothetical protein
MMKIRFSACAATLLKRTAAKVRAATMKRMDLSLMDGAPPAGANSKIAAKR